MLLKRISLDPPPLYPAGGWSQIRALRNRAKNSAQLKELLPAPYVLLPDLLSKVAAASNLSLIADAYVRDVSFNREWQQPIRDEPLWRVLRRIARDFQLDIQRRERFLLVRHSYWFFSELEEVPARELKTIWKKVSETRKVTLDDLSLWAGRLSEAQYASLPYLLPGVQLGSYPYLRLRSTLQPRQLRLLQGPGITWSELTGEQRAPLGRWLESQYPIRSEDALDSARVVEVERRGGRLVLAPYQATTGLLPRGVDYDPAEQLQPLESAPEKAPADALPRPPDSG